MKTRDLKKDFVVLSPDKRATPVAFTPELYGQLDERFDGFRGHELIACHEFRGDWSGWEVHPHGDEVVVLLSGSATFVLDMDDGQQRLSLSGPGEYLVVPRGVWHTALVTDRATLLFITPGEGTEHKPA